MKVLRKLRRFFSSIKRSLDYAIFGWSNPDWDFMYLYELKRFKLKRMHKKFKEFYNVDCIEDFESIKSLRIAIRILDRICEGYHEKVLYNKHEQKWGILDFKFFPTKNGFFTMESSYSNVITEEDKLKEREEFTAFSDKSESWKTRDKKILFRIFEKYSEYWWV